MNTTRPNSLALLTTAFVAAGSAAVASAQVVYVDDDASPAGDGLSWATAHRFLQDALTHAITVGTVTEIHVAQGTYTPDRDEANPAGGVNDCCVAHGGSGCSDAACEAMVCVAVPVCCVIGWDPVCVEIAADLCGTACVDFRTVTFRLVNGVALLGGCAGPGEPNPDLRDPNLYSTILSGDLAGDDGPPGSFLNYDENCFNVVTASGTDNSTILDGFTITGGNATGPDNADLNWLRGAGLWNLTGSPQIVNCRFEYNHAGGYGGGMYNRDSSSPGVSGCIFTGNVAAISGGGIYNFNASHPTVTGCDFTDNTAHPDSGAGGGMRNSTNCNPTVSSCTFTDNSARQGGGIENVNGSNGTVTDCTFTGNSSPTITNCRFQDNLRPNNGGAMFIQDDSH
ncbi:MAG: right-handed parallel beta-helix repeat-containing protein, partial [Planctomycetota bacterium]